MYGWLTLSDEGVLEINFPEWNFAVAPDPATLDTAARLQRVAAALEAAWPAPADLALKQAARAALLAACPHIPDEHLSYAIAMGIAFHQLHRADHAQAQAAIALTVEAELGGEPPDASPAIGQMVQRLKAVGFLLPAVSRPLMVNTFCTEVRNEVFGTPASPGLMALRASATQLADQVTLVVAESMRHEVWTTIHLALISSPKAELASLTQAIAALLKARRIDVFQQLAQRHGADEDTLLRCWRDRGLRQGLLAAQAHPERSAVDLAAAAFATIAAHNQLENEVLSRTTVAAVDAGVMLGEHTDSSRVALRQLRDAASANQRRQTTALQRQLRQTGARPDPTLPSRDVLQSWSVEQLVRWIDGPLVGARRGRAVDRRQVVAQARPAQKPVLHPARPGAPSPAVPYEDPPPLTEDDVGRIEAEAYAAAAVFFLGDIHDLLALGVQLRAPEGLRNACQSIVGGLQKLAQAHDGVDVAHAQELLTETEQRIQALRASIQIAQATADLQARFDQALGTALARETLSPGRREGGVIACPLQVEAWGWVAQRYHQRWLSSARALRIAGEWVRLDVDEALALYVTGSSLSQYAFDVSVHLWRRRAGKTSLPSDDQGVHPPMNTEDWFDTYVTCCVLHVRQST